MKKVFVVFIVAALLLTMVPASAYAAFVAYGRNSLTEGESKYVQFLDSNTDYQYGTFVKLLPSDNFLSSACSLVLNVNGVEKSFEVNAENFVITPQGNANLSDLKPGVELFIQEFNNGKCNILSPYKIGTNLNHGIVLGWYLMVGFDYTLQFKMFTGQNEVKVYEAPGRIQVVRGHNTTTMNVNSIYDQMDLITKFITFELNNDGLINRIYLYESFESLNDSVYDGTDNTIGGYTITDNTQIIFAVNDFGDSYDADGYSAKNYTYAHDRLIGGVSYDVDLYFDENNENNVLYAVVKGVNADIHTGIISSLEWYGEEMHLTIFDIIAQSEYSCIYSQFTNTYWTYENWDEMPVTEELKSVFESLKIGMMLNFKPDITYIEIINDDAVSDTKVTANLQFDQANRSNIVGSARVSNDDTDSHDVSLYLALYDDNKLLQLDQTNTQMRSLDRDLMVLAIRPENLSAQKKYSVKMYCWMDDMKPVTNRSIQV